MGVGKYKQDMSKLQIYSTNNEDYGYVVIKSEVEDLMETLHIEGNYSKYTAISFPPIIEIDCKFEQKGTIVAKYVSRGGKIVYPPKDIIVYMAIKFTTQELEKIRNMEAL